MVKLKADLHVQTFYSDGLMSPAEVVSEAAVNGVGVLSVTDHDCALAYPQVYELCVNKGIRAVSGIEISAYDHGVKVHTLGYNVNCGNSDFKCFLKSLFEGSLRRTEDIIFKLNKSGIRIRTEEVLNLRASPSAPVHGMHVARAGAAKGYAKSAFSFYSEYLASGKCAFSTVGRPSPREAIEAVNASGGFTSLAHPGRIELGAEEKLRLISKLKDCGLCGIEGVYSAHTAKETAYYKETAKAFNLLVTGGSDTHIKGGRKEIGTPAFFIDEALAEKLGF